MKDNLSIEQKYFELSQNLQKKPGLQITFEPQRILFVSDDFLPAKTGVGSYLQHITQELVQRGHQVVILSSRRPEQSAKEIWNGATVYRVFSIKIAGFYQALATQKTIEKIILENKINIIHFHYLSFLLEQTFKVGKKLGLPQVYTYHMSDRLLTQPWFMRPFRHLIHRKSLRQYNLFDFIVSPSRAVAEELRKEGISRPIHTISNPVRMNNPSLSSRGSTRRAGFQILFAGRLAVEKNIPLLIRAFAQLKASRHDSCLVIAGEGPERVELERLAKDLGVDSSVHFRGHLNAEDLAKEYNACDTFVLPSVLEVQAIVVLEAMRFGKPVIVTDAIASSAELVSPGDNGYIIDSKNPNFLAEKLMGLADSVELREKMGLASLQRSEQFDPEKILQQLQVVYQILSLHKENKRD